MISNVERNRRAEFGDQYDDYFKKCDNCWMVTNISHLYYINKEETVKICESCLDIIVSEHERRWNNKEKEEDENEEDDKSVYK